MLLIFIVASSCSSIFIELKKKATFETYPKGVNVFVNGIEKGKTPIQLRLVAKDRIDFKLDYYKEKAFIIDNKFNLISILNVSCIDSLTSSLEKENVKHIKLTLENLKKKAFMFNAKNKHTAKAKIYNRNNVIETVISLRE